MRAVIDRSVEIRIQRSLTMVYWWYFLRVETGRDPEACVRVLMCTFVHVCVCVLVCVYCLYIGWQNTDHSQSEDVCDYDAFWKLCETNVDVSI